MNITHTTTKLTTKQLLAITADRLMEAKETIADLVGQCLTPTQLAEIWSERQGDYKRNGYSMNMELAIYGFQTRTVERDPLTGERTYHYAPTELTAEHGYGKDVSGSRYKKRMHWRVEVLDALEEVMKKTHEAIRASFTQEELEEQW